MQAKSLLPNLGPENTIIYGCIVGSHAYGTEVEGSDIDKKWVYVQGTEDFFINGYKPQIEISKDEVAYELTRFIELLEKGNPTMLELLFSPVSCVLHMHPVFNLLLLMKNDFLTKKCKYSFGGYAISQIEKAKGLNKKGNWEKERTDRKSVLDFCYWITQGIESRMGDSFQTIKIKEKFKSHQISRMGLTKLPHVKDVYNLYWDSLSAFYGVVQDEITSNDITLSEVHESANNIGLLYFNKEEYSKHCREYNEYQTWLATRNTQRYIDMEKHGQLIDGKNMLHCMRLIETALDIAEFNTLIVRRNNAEHLKNIRHGVFNLEDILANAERKMTFMNAAFDASTLPDSFNSIGKLKSVHATIRRVAHTEKANKTYY